MSKNRSLGKQRLDKYYNLAKEKGYRARSAFKLLQLNKKYGFLKDAKILIDLCAAPGGWLQVAAQEMPRPRKIIGIDLDPIKYIGDVDSFVCDITSDECRKRLYGMLSDTELRQADVILHDGAPNVGTSWENDAFNQNLLVFYSLQLSSIFLREGGTFVTKIFRSDDYDSLINLLNKMFKKVEATKPLSSRSQSAEIFVVCLEYRGIKNFNEEELSYEKIFKNIENDFDEYKYTKIKMSEFIRSSDPEIINKITEIENDLEIDFDEEFLYLIKDLKILNKGDLKKILQKKKQIIRDVKSNKLQIPVLDFLKENEEESEYEEDFEMVTLTVEEKIKEIDNELNKMKKVQKIDKQTLCSIDGFYEDDMFKNMLLEDDTNEVIKQDIKKEEIEMESCSDSLDIDEEEMLCIARYKDNPTDFIESTVDRYWTDPEEKLPNYLREDQKCSSRPSKSNENKLTKKEKEALLRRKTRAERRAEKFMKDMIIEESDEERVVAKEIYRKEYKKTKTTPRIVFPKKGSCGIPKGKGRLLHFDRRLKKDKRAKKMKK
ncbi:ribosome biogenesis protein SPB1 [Vairimorpha necatrix]|uniref:Ribosome biogenesis protein SPB1 n=1 Tax=Vairimorpha necatrix TaxID=6039 RepID=A0AAX4JBC9_9MICR